MKPTRDFSEAIDYSAFCAAVGTHVPVAPGFVVLNSWGVGGAEARRIIAGEQNFPRPEDLKDEEVAGYVFANFSEAFVWNVAWYRMTKPELELRTIIWPDIKLTTAYVLLVGRPRSWWKRILKIRGEILTPSISSGLEASGQGRKESGESIAKSETE